MSQILPPLNKFRLIAQTLNSGSNSVYTEEIDVSTIILTSTVANKSIDPQTYSLLVNKSGSVTPVSIINDMIIPSKETFTPIGGEGKVVLEKGDAVIFETTTDNVLDITLSILENANN